MLLYSRSFSAEVNSRPSVKLKEYMHTIYTVHCCHKMCGYTFEQFRYSKLFLDAVESDSCII